MEIRGEDFIKKVQLKQEKNEIEQRLNEINNEESSYENKSRLDREIEIQEEREYSDIMLGQGKSNAQNKKKYLILGLALIILFLLTIIIIRLLSDDSSNNDNFTKEQTENTATSTENSNIEEQYQKIINEKLKNIKEEKEKEAAQEEKTAEQLSLEKLEQKEVVEEPTVKEETKPDVFEVKKAEPIYVAPKKEAVSEVVKKTEPVKTVQKKVEPTSSMVTTQPKGTFIQIGAFSNIPSDKYLNNITNKGFSYTIYKVTINGKLFHKVLIGPYKNSGSAKLAVNDVKKKLNVSGAFILTF